MGLDMTLRGDRYRGWKRDETPEERPNYMGFKLTEMQYEIAYWRKHNQLHGHIIKEYADDQDDCQDVYLSREALVELRDYLSTVKDGEFAATPGFFFGSDQADYHPDARKFDVDAIDNAIAFLDAQKEPENQYKMLNYKDEEISVCEFSHSVYYRASW